MSPNERWSWESLLILIHNWARIGCSLGDVYPMDTDWMVTFSSVYTWKYHVRVLKKMIILLLFYPHLRFSTSSRFSLWRGCSFVVLQLVKRLPVMERSGERSQPFNSPDLVGMKCTQLSPLKYENPRVIVHQNSANRVVQKWCKFLIDRKWWMKQDLTPIAPKKRLSSTLGTWILYTQP